MADLDYNRRNKVPRPLSDSEKARLEEFIDSIHYSARWVSPKPRLSSRSCPHYFKCNQDSWRFLNRYSDDEYEYRHVQLPKNMLKVIPKEYHDPSKGTLKLLWEEEWRALGITQVRPRRSYALDSRADWLPSESWLGTLRSSWARATHITLQVNTLLSLGSFHVRQC